MITSTATKALALLRMATGLVFLWAVLDKTFGLHYSPPSAKSWLNGASPTKSLLSCAEVGPFQSMYRTITGAGWVYAVVLVALAATYAGTTWGVGRPWARMLFVQRHRRAL